MAESATGGDNSISDEANGESMDDKSWEVINMYEITSDENKSITPKGSSINQKEKHEKSLSSSHIESLLSVGNGYYQVKMVEGKIYTLPFQFTMKPEVGTDGRFHFLKQNDVWYRLKRDDSGSLFLQNKETGSLTKLNESSISDDLMDGRGGNSSERHISDTSATSSVEIRIIPATDIDDPAGGKRVETAKGKECIRHGNKEHKATERVFAEKPEGKTDSKENRNVDLLSSEIDKHELKRGNELKKELEQIPNKEFSVMHMNNSESEFISSKCGRETDDVSGGQTGQQAGRKSDEERDLVQIPDENNKQESELNASETDVAGCGHRFKNIMCKSEMTHVHLCQTGGEERDQVLETEKHHKNNKGMAAAKLTPDGDEEQKPAKDNLYLLQKEDSDQGSGDEKEKSIKELRNGKLTNKIEKHHIQNKVVAVTNPSDIEEGMEGEVEEADSNQTVRADRNPTDVGLEESKHGAGTSSIVLTGETVVGTLNLTQSTNKISGQETDITCKGDVGTSELGKIEKLGKEGLLDLKRNAVSKMQDMINGFEENKGDTSVSQNYGKGLAQHSMREENKHLPNETNNADLGQIDNRKLDPDGRVVDISKQRSRENQIDMHKKSEDQTPQEGEYDKQIISEHDSNQTERGEKYAVETQRQTSPIPKSRTKKKNVNKNQRSDPSSLQKDADVGHVGNKEEDIRGSLEEMNGKECPKTSKEGGMKTDTSPLQAACAKLGKENLMILLKYRKASGDQFEKKMIELSCPQDFLKYWNFCTKTNEGKQMLEVIVRKHQCSVTVSSDDEDLFIFEVCDQYFEHKSHMKQFLNMVINNVYECAHKSLCLGCFSVEVVIQGDVLQRVKQSKELDAVWIAKAGEHDPGAMYAVSREEKRESVFSKITEIINIARKCFENHEEKVPADYIWQRVMAKFGYLEEMNGKFLKTKISYDEKMNAFLLKGVRNETKAAAEHLEKLMKIAHVEVHAEEFSGGCQFEIFKNPEMCDYIDSLIQNIPAPFVWIPNHQTQKLHIFSRNPKHINVIYKSIDSCVQEKPCPIPRDMLSIEEVKSIEELKKKHNGKVLIQLSDKAFLVTAASDIFESVYAAIQEICSQEKVKAEAVSRKMKPDHKTEYDITRSKGMLSEKGNEKSKSIEVHDRQFFKKLLKEDLSKFERLADQHDVTICKIEKPSRFGFELRGSEADVMFMFNSLSEKIKSKKEKMQLQHGNDIPAENVEAQMEASSANATKTDEVPPLSPQQGNENQSPAVVEDEEHQGEDDNETDEVPPLSPQQGNENQSPAVVEDEEHQGEDDNETDEVPPLSPQQGNENQSPAVVEDEEHQGEDDNGEQKKHGKQHSVWTYPNNKVLVLLKDSTCNADVVIIPEIDNRVSTSRSNGKDMVRRLGVPLWNKAEKEKHTLSDRIKEVLMGLSGKSLKSVGLCINPIGGWDFKHYLKCFLYEINTFYTGSSVNNSVECLSLFISDEVLYHAACDITQTYLKDKARKSSTEACDCTVQEGPVFKIIKVSLEKGCLHDAQTEVLVNTISTNLDLTKGAISASLLKKAGPGLQKEISSQLQPPAPYGVVLKTGACQLPCKAVYHGALKKYNARDDSTMLLQQFVLNCLQQASKSKYKTIAFPAIGTGNLNFPKDIVSGLMLTTILKFERSMPGTSLKEVKFVIFPTDTETYQVLEKQLKDFQLHPEEQTIQAKHANVMPAQMAISKTLQYGQVQVHAKLGTFENESQDCLLVFWNKQFLYNISKNKILHSAGSTVTQKWEEHRNQQLFKKDVILVTLGGSLKYTNIIHVACDISTINKAAGAGLMKADLESMKTVVVPIIPDDPIQIDVNKFCTGILRAVKEKATGLKVVQSVMFVIQGQHNFPFFNEVFERESKQYGTGKITGANQRNDHPVSGAKSVESRGSAPPEPIAQEISRDEEEVTQETQLQSYIGPEITLAGNTIQVAQSNKEKCCIILSGDIKGKEDLKKILSHYNTNKLKHIVWPYEEKSALVIFEKEVDVKTLELVTKPFKVEPLQPQVLQNLEFPLLDDIVERARNTSQVEALITNLEEIGGVGINRKDGQIFICAVTVHQMDIAKNCLEKFCERRLNIRINKQSKSTPSTTKVEESFNNIDTLDKVSEVEFLALNIFENGFERMKKVHISWGNNGTIVIQGPREHTTRVKTNLSSQLGALRTKQSEEISLDEKEKKVLKDVTGEVLFKDTVFVYDEKNSQVVVYSDKHSDILAFKHKLKVRSGKLKETGKRGKRFANSSQPAEAAEEGFSSLVTSESRSQFSWSKDASDVEVLYTKENIKVAVYMADILNLPVDCIVNAANDRMQHGGGVAKVIADAAGPELVQEGDAIIRNQGNIPVGFQVTTTAGRLPYRCVIHTVGPCWSDYTPHNLQNVKKCEEDLYKAIYGSFLMAEKKELSTVALPAVSSGIYAVPQDMCVVQYARAVQDYSRKSEPGKSLTEIHFVDKLPHLVKLIQNTFRTMLQDGKEPNYNVNNYVASSLSSYQRQSYETGMKGHQHHQPARLKDAGNSSQHGLVKNVEFSPVYYESGEHDKKQSIFQIYQKPVLLIYEGDVLKVKNIDAVICPDDKNGSGIWNIASELKRKEKYKKQKELRFKKEKPVLGDVVVTYGEEHPYRAIFHVVIESYEPKKPEFESVMKKCMDNIFRKANSWVHVKKIAVPLFGVKSGYMTEESWAKLFLERFLAFCHEFKHPNLQEVHIIIHYSSHSAYPKVKKIFSDFYEEANKDQMKKTVRPPRPPLPREYGTNSVAIQEPSSASVTVDAADDCVICMCPMTNPRTLPCGHSFCAGCVDELFKHKPVCPACGRIVGILTGDQPEDGKIDVKTSSLQLAGYEGNGSISITYTFLGGRQGPNHPSPGKFYSGLTRTAYLPDTPEGRIVCRMLQLAFKRRLVFTISQSRTTGKEGLTWNDIHHKTNPNPGTQFGYPDPDYLSRVKEELAAKGITEADLPPGDWIIQI